jgi:hypothetical protein
VTNQNPNEQAAAAAVLGFLAGAVTQNQQAGAVTPDQQAGQGKTKRPTDLTIWQWTLVPVVFVALRILIASQGDPDTLASLVQNLNITAVFLATILPFVATVIVLLFVMAVLATIDQWRTREAGEQLGMPRNEYAKSLSAAVVLLPFAAVLGWYTMSMKLLIITGFIIGLLVLVLLGSWFIPKLKRLLNIVGGVYFIVLILAALIVPVSQQGLWLPRERLTINGSKTGIVYILSSDDRWTRYLDEADQTYIVATQTVTGREPVQQPDDWTNRTLSDGFRRLTS